jgi:predicted DNA-binding protein YlxM (UPF0122 family)
MYGSIKLLENFEKQFYMYQLKVHLYSKKKLRKKLSGWYKLKKKTNELLVVLNGSFSIWIDILSES